MKFSHFRIRNILLRTILVTAPLAISASFTFQDIEIQSDNKQIQAGSIEVKVLHVKGTALIPWGCPDSIGINLKKTTTGYLPVNLNIKIVNLSEPYLTKVDTTIYVNQNNPFDSLIYYKNPCPGKEKAGLTDVVVVEALPGDSAYPIGNDTTKLKKEYCIRNSLDEMNYVDGCNVNDTAFGIESGIFVCAFSNNGPTILPIKSVEHVFRDSIGAAGKQYRIVIYSDTTMGLPGNLIYESGNLTSPTGTGSDQRIEHQLSTNVDIPAGRKFFAGIKQLTSGSIGASGQKESPVRSNSFYYSTNSGSTWTDFSTASLQIRPDIEPQTNPRLYLQLINEGFYNPFSNSMVADSFRVYALTALAPHTKVDSSIGIISGTSFDGIFGFNSLNRETNYYLQVRHRNHIQTWSSSPVQFRRYDFTVDDSSAYGSNLALIDNAPVYYGLFGGDTNQDESVDASDASQVDNDAYNFASGYLSTDVNGDGFVDASDAGIVDVNASNFVISIHP